MFVPEHVHDNGLPHPFNASIELNLATYIDTFIQSESSRHEIWISIAAELRASSSMWAMFRFAYAFNLIKTFYVKQM